MHYPCPNSNPLSHNILGRFNRTEIVPPGGHSHSPPKTQVVPTHPRSPLSKASSKPRNRRRIAAELGVQRATLPAAASDVPPRPRATRETKKLGVPRATPLEAALDRQKEGPEPMPRSDSDEGHDPDPPYRSPERRAACLAAPPRAKTADSEATPRPDSAACSRTSSPGCPTATPRSETTNSQ